MRKHVVDRALGAMDDKIVVLQIRDDLSDAGATHKFIADSINAYFGKPVLSRKDVEKYRRTRGLLQASGPDLPKPATSETVDDGEAVIKVEGAEKLNRENLIESIGYDPDKVTVKNYKVKQWDAQTPDGVTTMQSIGFNFVPSPTMFDLDLGEVIKSLTDTPSKREPNRDNGYAYSLLLGDLQLGKAQKAAGTDVTDTVERVNLAIDRAKAYFDTSSRNHVSFLGDCVEGFVSQGGQNSWMTELTITEQVRLLRLLMAKAVKSMGSDSDATITSIPGNHDQTTRHQNMPADDSWAVDALRAVQEGCELGGVYGNVEFVHPTVDEHDTIVDVDGLKIGSIHGHQWATGKHWDWWYGQTFSSQPIAEADVLACGHRHHARIETRSGKHFIQVPSFETESTWYRHKTGITGTPGGILLESLNGQITSIIPV